MRTIWKMILIACLGGALMFVAHLGAFAAAFYATDLRYPIGGRTFCFIRSPP